MIRWRVVATWALAAPAGLAPWIAWKVVGNWDKGEAMGLVWVVALVVLWAIVLIRPPAKGDLMPIEKFDRARAAVEEVRVVRHGSAGSRVGETVRDEVGDLFRVVEVRRRWPTANDRTVWQFLPGDYVETRVLEPS